MPDIFTVAERSARMSRIRGRGNASTEGRMVTMFRKARITGWRRHASLLGKPDFTFPREKVVVFVDGCFWHGCPKHFKAPVGNAEFWSVKIAANLKRDQAVNRQLRKQGWKVVRIWEHSLRARNSDATLRLIKNALARSE